MNILEETQLQRDLELALYSGRLLEEIQKLNIASSKSIQLYQNKDLDCEDYSFIYKNYPYLDVIDYIRTLSALTVERRAKYIYNLISISSLENKIVLDFGAGVGSHGISCAQFGAREVHLLDVDGPLRKYAQWRVIQRKISNVKFLEHDSILVPDYYDVILCLDVLEHIAKPFEKFKEVTKSLKSEGLLVIEVSTMKKPTSGHFSKSIDEWIIRGIPFLKEYFILLDSFIWKKK